MNKRTKRDLVIASITALVTYAVVHISHIHDKWDWSLTAKEIEGTFVVLASLGIIPIATMAKWRKKLSKNFEEYSEEKEKFLKDYHKLKEDIRKIKEGKR